MITVRNRPKPIDALTESWSSRVAEPTGDVVAVKCEAVAERVRLTRTSERRRKDVVARGDDSHVESSDRHDVSGPDREVRPRRAEGGVGVERVATCTTESGASAAVHEVANRKPLGQR